MSSSALEAVRIQGRRSVIAAAAGVGVVALAGLVLLGRWEDRRNVDAQLRGMRAVAAEIGPLDSGSLSGYRVQPSFDCLTYRRGAKPFALELCVDRSGRVVEAIDRTGSRNRYWTLRHEQSASTFRVDRAGVDRLLRKMGAPGT